jgi:hypothetical protein
MKGLFITLLFLPFQAFASIIALDITSADNQPHHLSGKLFLDTANIVYTERAPEELYTIPAGNVFGSRWFVDELFHYAGGATLEWSNFTFEGGSLTSDPVLYF